MTWRGDVEDAHPEGLDRLESHDEESLWPAYNLTQDNCNGAKGHCHVSNRNTKRQAQQHKD